jgi:hypothetical protein
MTTMMGTLAPLVMVLTLGPSEPNQHWPLLLLELMPRALKPSDVSELMLTKEDDDDEELGEADAAAEGTAADGLLTAADAVADAVAELALYIASFIKL